MAGTGWGKVKVGDTFTLDGQYEPQRWWQRLLRRPKRPLTARVIGLLPNPEHPHIVVWCA